MTTRRQQKFVSQLANGIDVIVRGVKSGLPLNECLQVIARESPEPLAGEFREVVEQQRLGVPLSEGLERMSERLPLAEVRFLDDRHRASSSRPAATCPRRWAIWRACCAIVRCWR